MKIVCEVCGSSSMIKKIGIYVCENCGCRFSLEEVQKMLTKEKKDLVKEEQIILEKNDVAIKVRTVGHISYIPDIHFVKGADSAGRIGCEFALRNLSGKAIESALVYFSGYDANHKLCKDMVSNEEIRTKLVEGPISRHEIKTVVLDGGWYNREIISVEVEQVDLTFIDGSKETFGKEHFPVEPVVVVKKSFFGRKSSKKYI